MIQRVNVSDHLATGRFNIRICAFNHTLLDPFSRHNGPGQANWPGLIQSRVPCELPPIYHGDVTQMLLQTKLYVPMARGSLVPRPRLLTKLNAGLSGRLTLVAAPAGFGKTTLIARWGKELADAGEWALAWYSLDEGDNEPLTFFNYLVAALQTIDGRLGQAGLELLQVQQADDLHVVLTTLLNDVSGAGRAILLVLDDYHLMVNAAVHQAVRFLLENAPPHFHLVLLSRADPPFSLARLRARRQMTEIRQDDLRFSHDEALHFFRRLTELDLPEDAVASLERRTEGWVAGLQMAALALAEREGASAQARADVEHFIADFSGSHRYIFDYLAEEALRLRPAGTRDFLLQTAVLERLCASLCDAVLLREGSQSILEQIENANLFLVRLDDVRHWYRYHHLFSDLLRHYLRREQSGLIPTLHLRASRWYEDEGYPDEAVQHALAGVDYERAANLVAQYSQSLVHRGEINTLLVWIGRLPAEWQRRHPQLIFNHAWALLFRDGPQEMEAVLSHLPYEVANSVPYSAFLLVLRGLAATRQGQTDEAIALAEKAESQLATLEPGLNNLSMRGVNAMILATAYRRRDSARAAHFYQEAASLCRESGNLIVFWTAVRDRGKLLLEQGQLHAAETILLEGIQSEKEWLRQSGTQDRRLLAAAPIHVALAQLYYEWNQLDRAEAHLVDADRLLVLIGPVNQSEGLAALARLHLAHGNVEAIPPLLTKLERLQEAANDRYTRQQLAIAMAETCRALYQHEPTPALRLTLERSLPVLGDEPMAILARARVLLALARPAEALPLLDTLDKQTQENSRHGLWLSTAICRCLAQYQSGEQANALDGLRQALPLAEPSGYIRLFLDMGHAMAELLQTAVRQKIQSDYAAALLTLFPQTDATIPSPRQSDVESLSPRETEVLQLIAQGLTNKEIGAKLFIATSTAKRHTVNIYNKLAVNNRAEATARAYELGIVGEH